MIEEADLAIDRQMEEGPKVPAPPVPAALDKKGEASKTFPTTKRYSGLIDTGENGPNRYNETFNPPMQTGKPNDHARALGAKQKHKCPEEGCEVKSITKVRIDAHINSCPIRKQRLEDERLAKTINAVVVKQNEANMKVMAQVVAQSTSQAIAQTLVAMGVVSPDKIPTPPPPPTDANENQPTAVGDAGAAPRKKRARRKKKQ